MEMEPFSFPILYTYPIFRNNYIIITVVDTMYYPNRLEHAAIVQLKKHHGKYEGKDNFLCML